MGWNEIGKFVVDDTAIAAMFDNENSLLRKKADELYGPPKPPTTLWYLSNNGIYAITKDLFIVSQVGLDPIITLTGWKDGAAFAIVNEQNTEKTRIQAFFPFYYAATDSWMFCLPTLNHVQGISKDVFINGVTSDPMTNRLFIWAGSKIYVGVPEFTPATTPEETGPWEWLDITFTEYVNAPIDAGTSSLSMALGKDGNTGESAFYAATPDGDLWLIPETGDPYQMVTNDISVTTFVQTDPTTAENAMPFIYSATTIAGVWGLFNNSTITANVHPFAVYDGVGYVALDSEIARFKAGSATKSVVSDVNVKMMAISTS